MKRWKIIDSKRLDRPATATDKHRLSTYLTNPKKYFYPMNLSPTSNTFLTLNPRKSSEKLPEFLRDILSIAPERPRALSQVKLQLSKEMIKITPTKEKLLNSVRVIIPKFKRKT